MKEFVIWYGKERADVWDMEDATGYLPLIEHMRANRVFRMPEGRAEAGSTTTFEARIFSGFNLSGRSGQTIVLNRGSGIFPLIHQGQLYFGMLVGEEGLASQTLDFTALGDAVYGVWVRIVYAEATEENRVFWDQVGAAEEVDMVATRNQVSWEYQVVDVTAADPAAGDWVKVGTVTKATTLTADADLRQLYFEGYAGAGADQWAHEWGDGANDRSTSRGLYGIADMHEWVQAVRRQLADLIGQSAWYKNTSENTVRSVAPAVSSPPSPNPIWDRAFTWYNQRGAEVMRYTKMGRLARISRHEDDFNYHASYWGSALDTDPHYGTLVTGTGTVSAANGKLKLRGTSTDTAFIIGEPIFQFRDAGPTNLHMAGMYVLLPSYSSLSGDLKIQIGWTEGVNFRIWWEHDSSVDSNWHLKGDDGAGGTFDFDTSLVAGTATVTHLEFAVDPFSGSNVGVVMGTCDKGGVNSSNWPGTTLPGAGATFLSAPYSMFANLVSISGGWKTIYIDYWEAWQEIMHAGLNT